MKIENYRSKWRGYFFYNFPDLLELEKELCSFSQPRILPIEDILEMATALSWDLVKNDSEIFKKFLYIINVDIQNRAQNILDYWRFFTPNLEHPDPKEKLQRISYEDKSYIGCSFKQLPFIYIKTHHSKLTEKYRTKIMKIIPDLKLSKREIFYVKESHFPKTPTELWERLTPEKGNPYYSHFQEKISEMQAILLFYLTHDYWAFSDKRNWTKHREAARKYLSINKRQVPDLERKARILLNKPKANRGKYPKPYNKEEMQFLKGRFKKGNNLTKHEYMRTMMKILTEYIKDPQKYSEDIKEFGGINRVMKEKEKLIITLRRIAFE